MHGPPPKKKKREKKDNDTDKLLIGQEKKLINTKVRLQITYNQEQLEARSNELTQSMYRKKNIA